MSDTKPINRMTVTELKRLLADWPETDAHGSPSEVWIETGFALSSAVIAAAELNDTDLLLESARFDRPGDGWNRSTRGHDATDR